MELKRNVIDGIMSNFNKFDLLENHESSNRRAIYQLPFFQVKVMNQIL